jgi:hypothetical protein
MQMHLSGILPERERAAFRQPIRENKRARFMLNSSSWLSPFSKAGFFPDAIRTCGDS